jgi:hypothetical protein
MGKTASAFPVIPGQDPKAIAALIRSRPDEHRESRTRAGITMERAYQMDTPMGTFVIVYLEAEGDPSDSFARVAASESAFDRDFVAALQRVHGIDVTQPPPGPPPEIIGDWEDPGVAERKRGFAFAAPLMPGRTDAGRAFGRDAWVDRLAEFTESRRALGQSRETVVLNSTPMGDIVCVYLEGDDPVEANRRFAASARPFDVWFKEQLATLFPPEIDFGQPVPGVQQIFDWQRTAATV